MEFNLRPQKIKPIVWLGIKPNCRPTGTVKKPGVDYNRGMAHELVNHLKRIQKETAGNLFNLKRLKELRQTAVESFDKKINQLISDRGLIKKIKVPQFYIGLWKHRGQQVKIPINWRYLLSSPFIYSMIFPSIIWHVGIEIYHQICFRLYGIPLVNYREYFIYDRQLLSLLNRWEKINCYYCSYVNNLIRYSVEIGGRTERYWCPIKYYRRIKNAHSQYEKFIGKKDTEKMRQQWKELRDFNDLKESSSGEKQA